MRPPGFVGPEWTRTLSKQLLSGICPGLCFGRWSSLGSPLTRLFGIGFLCRKFGWKLTHLAILAFYRLLHEPSALVIYDFRISVFGCYLPGLTAILFILFCILVCSGLLCSWIWDCKVQIWNELSIFIALGLINRFRTPELPNFPIARLILL